MSKDELRVAPKRIHVSYSLAVSTTFDSLFCVILSGSLLQDVIFLLVFFPFLKSECFVQVVWVGVQCLAGSVEIAGGFRAGTEQVSPARGKSPFVLLKMRIEPERVELSFLAP